MQIKIKQLNFNQVKKKIKIYNYPKKKCKSEYGKKIEQGKNFRFQKKKKERKKERLGLVLDQIWKPPKNKIKWKQKF